MPRIDLNIKGNKVDDLFDFVLKLYVLAGDHEQHKQGVDVDVCGVVLAGYELADGLDVSGVHLQDQQQLPFGDVHFALLDREVAQLAFRAREYLGRD